MKFLDKLKSSGFLTGAALLAVAGLLSRVIGVIFRVPLTNIVGNFGMGLYQMVFPLYSLLLVVSSAGLPVAISKMVAAEKTGGDFSLCRKILFNAVILLGAIGLCVSVLFTVFAYPIATMQGNADVGIVYVAVAPSVCLVCIIAAFRGYFQGLQNMVPTAASQIIEQIIKVAAGITLSLLLIPAGVVWAVFGAILAVTISELGALLYLFISYLISLKKEKDAKATPADNNQSTQDANTNKTAVAQVSAAENNNTQKFTPADKSAAPQKTKQKLKKLFDFKLMKTLLKQSLPITIMASVFPLILVFDSMIVINMLSAAGETHKSATQLFGISSGSVHTLINLPAVMGAAIAAAIVPMVSGLLKQNKIEELRGKTAMSVKIAVLVSLFFSVCYFVFAEKIIDLLYHDAFADKPAELQTAGTLMKIESFLIILMSLSSVFTAMMQGAGKSKFPLIALVSGGAAKIIFELCFLQSPIGIYSVSIGNVLCFAIACGLNAFFALKYVKIKRGLFPVFVKCAALAVLLFLFVWALNSALPPSRWWLFLAGTLALCFYVFFIYVLRLFDNFGEKGFNNIQTGK